MPAPYSNDLRQKVFEAVERGEGKSNVSQMFNVSRNTSDLWLKRREAMGSPMPSGTSNAVQRLRLPIWSSFAPLGKQMDS